MPIKDLSQKGPKRAQEPRGDLHAEHCSTLNGRAKLSSVRDESHQKTLARYGVKPEFSPFSIPSNDTESGRPSPVVLPRHFAEAEGKEHLTALMPLLWWGA